MNMHPHSAPEELAAGVTLDGLFRANAAARPNAVAIVDPANRTNFTDGAAKRLTYAEMDASVTRLAETLHSFAMPVGSVVAVQLPNLAEAVIALLAVMRAGHVAAPVPMLWRRSDLVAALSGIAPRAMITLSRLGGERPAETMCEAAAELFDLSFPCAFGDHVPDGVVSLDRHEPVVLQTTAAHYSSGGVSIVTFDADAHGFFPTGRTDAQWLAAGLATLLEARIETGDAIVSTLPLNSLASIASGFVPWLLCGGTLELAQGSTQQAGAHADRARRAHFVAPAAALRELAKPSAGSFGSCIAVHRGQRFLSLDLSNVASDHIVDLLAFGELGVIPLLRHDKRVSRDIPLGGIRAPSGAAGAPVVVETKLSNGQIGLRGPMVPKESFPPGLGSFRTPRDEEGFVRTGYKGRNGGSGGLIVGDGPDRVILTGGLRFGLDDLQSRFSTCGYEVKVSSIKDPLLGDRLHIEAADRDAVAAALLAAGHSQIVIDAAAGASGRSMTS
jgi:hypothetical protein